MNLTNSVFGYLALAVFAFAYLLVASEEVHKLSKSKPMILGAGIIWILVAILARKNGLPAEEVKAAISHSLVDFASLFLFLLVAMTYVTALTERNLFAALRAWLINSRFSYRQIFWMTGILAFLISPIADNLTTALLLGAVVMAVGQEDPRFVSLACINIVVAANAGGAYSPFGDITTLMVWEAGKVPTAEFLRLFVPALVNFVVPAGIMNFALPTGLPAAECEKIRPKRGALIIGILFLLTIMTALGFEHGLELPAFLGMMTGLSYLMLFSFYLQRLGSGSSEAETAGFNIFDTVAGAEWDTLLFFFGVIFCLGGLSFIGYLEVASSALYGTLGLTFANILVGVLSAIVDNIPVMFAVLTMNPNMGTEQWLLVCLTAGVGGSMLSIGSAAGVALMGQSAGRYSFFGHLKWSWAIALGYICSIWVHYAMNMA